MKKIPIILALTVLFLAGCESESDEASKTPDDTPSCDTCDTKCPEGKQICGTSCCDIVDCQAEQGFFMCGGKCTNLAQNHLVMCSTCLEGWCDADHDMANGCEFSAYAHHLNQACDACESGWCDADNDLTNGCESALTDRHQSTCDTCQPGYGDCDGDATNGCEQKLTADRDHCGACGNQCHAFEYCVHGECASLCSAEYGLAVCGENCVDLTQNHLISCDTCQINWCDADHDMATNGCEASAEYLHQNADCATCAAGFCDLDQNASNGCEADMTVLHLSSCDACAPGWCDADNDLTNGCEDEASTSTVNCGTCGHACEIGEKCYHGQCRQCPLDQTGCGENCVDLTPLHWTDCDGTCVAGYADCDNEASNGCETNIASDSLNCGACGQECRPEDTCDAGTCTMPCRSYETPCDNECVNLTQRHWTDCSGTCMPDHADCDGDPVNGCETDLLNNHDHCGTCNNACGEASCLSGTCKCPSGLHFCSGDCADFQTDIKHCGECDIDLYKKYDLDAMHAKAFTCENGHVKSTCWDRENTYSTYENCDGNDENGCENLSTNPITYEQTCHHH